MSQPFTCTQCRALLHLYIGDQLDEIDRVQVDAHLADCGACQRELALWDMIAAEVYHSRAVAQPASPQWEALARRLNVDADYHAPVKPKVHRMIENAPPPLSPVGDIPVPAHANQSRSRWTRFDRIVPIIAVLMLIILAGVIFFNRHQPVQFNPNVCNGGPIISRVPANGTIAGIDMINSDEGWGAGWLNVAGGTQGEVVSIDSLWDPSIPLIVHYQDCRWTPVSIAGLPHAQLFSISFGSATDGWAVGSTIKHIDDHGRDALAYDQTILLHYDGTIWHLVSLPGNPSLQRAQVQMLSPQEGWLVGDVLAGKNPQRLTHPIVVYHYQHGIWSRVDTSSLGPGRSVIKLAAVSAGECWILNADGILHYRDGVWSRQNVPDVILTDFAMTSPNSGWVVGLQIVGGPGPEPDYLAHYDGTTWRQVTAPLPFGRPVPFNQLISVAATDADHVWALGLSDDGYYLDRLQNGKWTAAPLHYIGAPIAKGQVQMLHNLMMLSPADGWILAGEPLPFTDFGPSHTIFIHLSGTQWAVVADG